MLVCELILLLEKMPDGAEVMLYDGEYAIDYRAEEVVLVDKDSTDSKESISLPYVVIK